MDLAEILQGLASNDLEDLKRQEAALQEFYRELDTEHSKDFPTLDNLLRELGHFINLRMKEIVERGG